MGTYSGLGFAVDFVLTGIAYCLIPVILRNTVFKEGCIKSVKYSAVIANAIGIKVVISIIQYASTGGWDSNLITMFFWAAITSIFISPQMTEERKAKIATIDLLKRINASKTTRRRVKNIAPKFYDRESGLNSYRGIYSVIKDCVDEASVIVALNGDTKNTCEPAPIPVTPTKATETGVESGGGAPICEVSAPHAPEVIGSTARSCEASAASAAIVKGNRWKIIGITMISLLCIAIIVIIVMGANFSKAIEERDKYQEQLSEVKADLQYINDAVCIIVEGDKLYYHTPTCTQLPDEYMYRAAIPNLIMIKKEGYKPCPTCYK